MTVPALAYFWGEDAFSLDRAADAFAKQLEVDAGGPLDVWRTTADEDDGDNGGLGKRRARVIEQVEQRLATSPMFSGGTIVVLRQPASLLREGVAREQLVRLLDGVAPGNALAFTDLIASGGKGPAQSGVLRDAVAERGGHVKEFPALSRERMEGWLTERGKELDVSFAPGVARVLAERVGAYVREGDVDRRRQSELANAEIQKLALYKPGATLTKADIDELVTEAVPGSTWAFLDAVGSRRGSEAATLARRLLDEATAMPVLITQLHRRLRELIVVREHIDAGTRPPDLIKELKVQPFRAQKLTEQARTWTQDELDDAFRGLF
ncbi:MAG: DNA polymerase III subunit delta, partial [Candidatus Limnocylindrales bacterium]